MRLPLPRRALLAATLTGCSAPLPEGPVSGTGEGVMLLDRAATSHGSAGFAAAREIAVSYDGVWTPLIHRLQPALVDRGRRGTSAERVVPHDGVVTQAYAGPEGRKEVLRRWAPDAATPGTVTVRLDGDETRDPEKRAAAALVADGYALFLLGPLLLAGPWRRARGVTAERGGSEDIIVGGRTHVCDLLHVRIAPGLGFSPAERLVLFLDREDGLMRRVRFSLDGLATTRGAVAEVDAWEHRLVGGLRFPTRFHERLLRPLPMPVHDWWATRLELG